MLPGEEKLWTVSGVTGYYTLSATWKGDLEGGRFLHCFCLRVYMNTNQVSLL